MLSLSLRITLTSALLLFSTPPCYSSEKEISELIANHREIQFYDRTLNEDYQQLMNLLNENEKKQLQQEQKTWLKKRNLLAHSVDNIKDLYLDRTKTLSALLENKLSYIESILITDEEKVNHKDQLKKTEHCKLDLCNHYRAYFLSRINDPTAREALEQVLKKKDHDLNNQNIEELDVLRELFITPECELPLWLIIENPQLLSLLGERFSPSIKASYHVYDLPAFTKLRTQLDNMEEGRWVTTSYMPHAGTIAKDIAAATRNYLNYLSFYPQGIIEKPFMANTHTAENLFPLLAWSYQGIWNRHSYIKFEALFHEASQELRAYYEEHERLKSFAPYAEWLLASYIHYCFPLVYAIAEKPAFQIFHGPHLSLATLKEKTTSFSTEDWNQALSIAILNHYSQDIIEWIIQSGADINAPFLNETPLMKAVDQPAIVQLLLKRGAIVDQETPFGKTALFYAIQFNQFDSIKSLIKAKANINHRLKNIDTFKKLEEDYLLEKVDSFTPYIYSLRYASPDVTAYLVTQGADTNALAQAQYQEWVSTDFTT